MYNDKRNFVIQECYTICHSRMKKKRKKKERNYKRYRYRITRNERSKVKTRKSIQGVRAFSSRLEDDKRNKTILFAYLFFLRGSVERRWLTSKAGSFDTPSSFCGELCRLFNRVPRDCHVLYNRCSVNRFSQS